MMGSDLASYRYGSDRPSCAHQYLAAAVLRLIGPCPCRIFELGCGNGAFARQLAARGHDVTGVDPSADGIRLARAADPTLRLEQGDGYEPLAEKFGTFPIVVSLEVIEHVMWPRKFVATCRELLEPGGKLILSTPFHGYWKNLAIALVGGFDRHVSPLWDGGHIKFWSERTLGALLAEAGFHDIEFNRVGRISPLAKSIVAVGRR